MDATCRLRKNYDGNVGIYPVLPFDQNGFEIIARIVPAHGNRISASHHMFEKWERQQAFFDYKSHITVRLDQAGQNKGLQNTHVIADKYTRRFYVSDDVQVFYLEAPPYGLKRLYGIQAALNPVIVGICALFAQPRGFQDEHRYFNIEYQGGVDAGKPVCRSIRRTIRILSRQIVHCHLEATIA